MKVIITIISLTIPLIVNGQYDFNNDLVSRQILSLTNKISKAERFDSKYVYYEAKTTEQYKRFEKLTEIATVDELKELMNHKSPYVRVYSFWALAKKHYDKLDSIILSHKDDNAIIETQSGCIGYQDNVVHLIIEIVTPNYWDMECKKLTKGQLEDLYLKIYNKKVNINVEPISEEQVQRQIESEFNEMIERNKNKDAKLNSFKGIAAVLNETTDKLLVFETSNNFKIYNIPTGQLIDTFSIKTKKDIRADLTHFTNEELIYLGTWKNYKRDKSVYWTINQKTREIQFLKCNKTPFGCTKKLTDSYVYTNLSDNGTLYYIGSKTKFVYGDKYLLYEGGLVSVYEKK